jgi:hypothetical protein
MTANHAQSRERRFLAQPSNHAFFRASSFLAQRPNHASSALFRELALIGGKTFVQAAVEA